MYTWEGQGTDSCSPAPPTERRARLSPAPLPGSKPLPRPLGPHSSVHQNHLAGLFKEGPLGPPPRVSGSVSSGSGICDRPSRAAAAPHFGNTASATHLGRSLTKRHSRQEGLGGASRSAPKPLAIGRAQLPSPASQNHPQASLSPAGFSCHSPSH